MDRTANTHPSPREPSFFVTLALFALCAAGGLGAFWAQPKANAQGIAPTHRPQAARLAPAPRAPIEALPSSER